MTIALRGSVHDAAFHLNIDVLPSNLNFQTVSEASGT